MPNLIDSSFQTTVAGGVGQRISAKADIDFMQYALRDNTANLVEWLIGSAFDNTLTYILKGCIKTSSGGTTTISVGYIFGISKAFGGMVARTYLYRHGGSAFPDPVGPDVVVCKTTTTYTAFDPTTFSDTSTHNIHAVIEVEFSAGPSGSGDVDFADMITAREYDFIQVSGFLSGMTVDFTQNRTYASGSGSSGTNVVNIDMTNARPGAEVVIISSVYSTDTITFTGPGIVRVISGAASQTAAITGNWYMRLKYDYFSGVSVEIFNY